MTAIEAIARIRKRHCIHNEHCTCNCKRGNEYCEYGLALEALEKQIPKKPNKSEREIRYCEVWRCPNCGFEWSARVVDYCYKCGQAIDWSQAGDTNG